VQAEGREGAGCATAAPEAKTSGVSRSTASDLTLPLWPRQLASGVARAVSHTPTV